jgi:hypothetical protein
MKDPIYNVDTEFDKCMEHRNDINNALVYTRLALPLKLDLMKHLFPILFPVLYSLKTLGKY